MFAHADKTLHWKISSNINDTDTFLPPYLFLKNVMFRHEFVDEFFMNFVREIRTNSCEFFARKIGYVTNGLHCR